MASRVSFSGGQRSVSRVASPRLRSVTAKIAAAAKAADQLSKQLDELHAEIGADLYAKVEEAAPWAFGVDGSKLRALAKELAPADEEAGDGLAPPRPPSK